MDKNHTIASHLEILQLATGERTTLYSAPRLFEAPNWSRDGHFLIINEDGKLYRLNLEQPQPQLIDTGFADRNNNDHGISPDGSQLAISHHATDAEGESLIYTLPIDGGTPTRITQRGPSYWHSWSPDGKTLLFVAGRDRDSGYCIYSMPAKGGEEIPLTYGAWLDDGPDFTPDGTTIYYNSAQSGRMQIWRMNADGSDAEQVVESTGSDWFPHPSPDGRSVVFLRYLEDQGEDHPFGRDVELMLLDTSNDQVRPLTDVFFGGQGTINVPSWSPDGSRLAFVSYQALN